MLRSWLSPTRFSFATRETRDLERPLCYVKERQFGQHGAASLTLLMWCVLVSVVQGVLQFHPCALGFPQCYLGLDSCSSCEGEWSQKWPTFPFWWHQWSLSLYSNKIPPCGGLSGTLPHIRVFTYGYLSLYHNTCHYIDYYIFLIYLLYICIFFCIPN